MLCGAHRTGKTTLAKAFSTYSGMPFVQTGASAVFAEMGLDPRVDYPLEVRLDIQKRILEAFEKQCRQSGHREFITDRTPIDFMAYTLADIQRENVPDALGKDIEKYLLDCASVSNSLFSVLMVVQPGIPLIDEPGKARASMPYIEHINTLVMGLVVSERIESMHYYIPRRIISIEDRVECISNALLSSEQRYEKQKKAMQNAGIVTAIH